MESKEDIGTLLERAKIAVMNAQEYLRVVEQNHLEDERPRAERALIESIDHLSSLMGTAGQPEPSLDFAEETNGW